VKRFFEASAKSEPVVAMPSSFRSERVEMVEIEMVKIGVVEIEMVKIGVVEIGMVKIIRVEIE
jgi:hypothetical protein